MAKFLLFASLLVLSGIVAQEGGTHEDHEGHEGHEGHPPLREVFDELKEEFHGRFGEEHDNQGEFTKTIAVTFALKGVQDDKGQFYHSMNQIDALSWQDPAWLISSTEGKFNVLVESNPSRKDLHAGRPATYIFKYDIYQNEGVGNDGFYLSGAENRVVASDDLYDDAAVRTVVVTPIDWETCLNHPENMDLIECRQIKYLQGVPCRNLHIQYQQECLDFNGRPIPPEAAANLAPIELTTSFAVNQVDEDGVQTGKFYLDCKDKDPSYRYEKRFYGFFDFPKGAYLPKCSVCDRKSACGPNSECIDLGKGEYRCRCLPGYHEEDKICTRNPSIPVIQLRFFNFEQSYSVVKQCGSYVEEGYDIIVGDNPDDNPSNYMVDVAYAQELLPESVLEIGNFPVVYQLLKRTSDWRNREEVNRAQRRVEVIPVNRCDVPGCGVQCPANTSCNWKNGGDDRVVHYPHDIECFCDQPTECVDPLKDPQVLQKLEEGYRMHFDPSRVCYHESGTLETTECEDVAKPILFWRDYIYPLYTCRVCHQAWYEGEFTPPDCVYYDYHDNTTLPCSFQRGVKVVMNETYTRETITLLAADKAGNVLTQDIYLYHQIQNVSEDITELIRFRRQMKEFEEGVIAVWTVIKWLIVIMLVVTLCWFLTEDGSFFFRVLCYKIVNPGKPWKACVADVEAQIILEQLQQKQKQT